MYAGTGGRFTEVPYVNEESERALEYRRRARRFVEQHTIDDEDRAELLSMLGLDDDSLNG
jgi:hypothetical protein